MKRVGVVVREKIIDEIKDKVHSSQACFFINFSKVNAFSLNVVRNNLSTVGADLFVAKNSLFKRAFRELEWE